ncbi:hypothetical protein NQ317_011668 [Molorchus minor]|uniref:Uncharacterized protein n=1 Tax=Molorchus minor TaxID=1323400 RepID=A0ABQ9JHG6_9CUCU|nr:hypothetical protein NQ317_011668 [Molorchus minor]
MMLKRCGLEKFKVQCAILEQNTTITDTSGVRMYRFLITKLLNAVDVVILQAGGSYLKKKINLKLTQTVYSYTCACFIHIPNKRTENSNYFEDRAASIATKLKALVITELQQQGLAKPHPGMSKIIFLEFK